MDLQTLEIKKIKTQTQKKERDPLALFPIREKENGSPLFIYCPFRFPEQNTVYGRLAPRVCTPHYPAARELALGG